MSPHLQARQQASSTYRCTHRWHDSYAHYYGRNGEMSAQFQSMRDKLDLPGIPITENELEALNEAYSVGSGDASKELFLRSLPGKLRLRGSRDNNHWKSSAYVFEGVDPSCFACNDLCYGVDNLSNSTDGCTGDTQAVSSVSGSTGATEAIRGKNSYQVPSEMVGNTSDASIGTEMDAFHDFIPMYQEVTKLVDGTGLKHIARKHFHSMLIELKH